MSADRIWKLIARKLSHEASQEELHELDLLLREHPDLHFPIQTITDLWQVPEQTGQMSIQSVDGTKLEQAYQEHIHRMMQKGIALPNHTDEPPDNTYLLTGSRIPIAIRNIRKYFVWTAVLILVVFGAYWFYSKSAKPPVTDNATSPDILSEVSTLNGSKTDILLPDGTQVHLNAGSKLTYDKQYGNVIREVNLVGEAYFDVVKNPEKPFVIHTSKIDIKVIGTEFNVKSYPGDKTTEASLIRGSIEVVIRNKPSEKFTLKPNEKIVVLNDADSLKKNISAKNDKVKKDSPVHVTNITYVPKYDAVLETSWIENKLIFRNESFKDLAIKMERWFGVQIRFKDKSIEEVRFNGIFIKDDSIITALKALKISEPFNYTMQDGVIVISK